MSVHVCAVPGCAELTAGTRCPTHTRDRQNVTRRRYRRNDYGGEWPSVRRRQLRREPTCRSCAGRGVDTPATVVDHIVPFHHFATRRQAHDTTNLQSLCKPCHDRKTATVDSAFGR